jgi:succinate dehydrogenase / fumarate reductase membrane anchor subunit
MTTPLGRVRGLGSAKGGTRSYVLKQASGLALGLLTPYMIGVGIFLFGRDREFVIAFMGSFWIAPASQAAIIEDYIHSHMRKLALLFLNSFFTWSVCIVCVIAILRMMFQSVQV